MDTFQVNKPILDKVSLSLTLYPADHKSCLLFTTSATGEYAVQILRCYLTVGRIIPKNPKISSLSYNFLRHIIKKSKLDIENLKN